MTKPHKDAVVKAGVGVIVVKDQKILVGKRKGSHGAGMFAFPGGHIDITDKTLAACGEREVFEETGIICQVFRPDHYRQDLFTNYKILDDEGLKIYVTCYLIADYLHGGEEISHFEDVRIKPVEEDKCEYWIWMDLDELSKLVSSEEQRKWIPIHEVIYYLKELWK